MPQALPPHEPSPPPAIIVTGNALPEPSSGAAYSVDALKRTQLVNAPSRGLEAILEQVPGLQLFRRSDSTSGHPTSQGVTFRALGGNASSRALLVLDGVPQSDPFGGWVNWPAYDPAGLERVRVVRGGGSVPYGPGALAGVIEMESLSQPGANASIEAGSRSSLAGHAYVGAPLGSGLLSLDSQGARSDGFIPVTERSRGPADKRSPFREASVRARWLTAIGKHVELQSSVLAFTDVRERGLEFTGNRTRGADASLRLVARGRWQWSASVYGQWRNFRSSFASVDDERTASTRVALQDDVPSSGFGGRVEIRPPLGSGIELRIGGDWRFTKGESNEYYSYSAGHPRNRRTAGGRSSVEGLFTEASWAGGSLAVSAGLRLDHWSVWDGRLVETPIATGIATRDEHYPKRNGWRPTARAGAAIDAGSGFTIRSSAYLGWRLPTLNELFRPFRAGPDATAANPFLEPERLQGAEAGIDFRRGGAQLGLSAFTNRLSGAIANVTLAHGPGLFPGVGFVAGNYSQRRNLDSVSVRGIEARGEAVCGPWFVRAAASFTRARVSGEGPAASLEGLRPAQTPRFAASAEAGWEKGDRIVTIQLRRNGARFEDDRNTLRLPPATSLGAFVAWPLSKHVQFIARGDNLLGETILAGLDSDGTTERASPRTLWVGLRFGSW